jgi:hypothetical protein
VRSSGLRRAPSARVNGTDSRPRAPIQARKFALVSFCRAHREPQKPKLIPVLSLSALCCRLLSYGCASLGTGPHRLGCVYHQQGVCRLGDDAVIADVLVMPKIIKVRPIAITIGRYRKSKAIAKQESAYS